MKKHQLLYLTLIYMILSNTGISQFQNIVVNESWRTDLNEPSIAINPSNPDNLVIGVNNTFCYASFDAGQSWSGRQMYSSYGVWGDPSLVFDSEGNCYFAHLSGEPPLSGRWGDRIVIQKSTDGGIIWNDGTFTGLNRPKFTDKEWLAVDLTNSQYHNNLYVAWTEYDRLFDPGIQFKSREMFSRSTDGGATWSDPIQLNEVEGDCLDDDNTIQGATPTIGPNGEIYLAWAGPEGILFDRSFDGGVTFGNDIFVTDHIGGWGWGYEIAGIYGNGLPQTICDLSNSPYRGTVYILWADQRNGTTNTDIFLIKSTDAGDSWSDIVRVNDDETDRAQFYPWMSIDPVTGIMYIVYYDRRSTLNTLTEVYVARSTDGGETFYNFKISESPFAATSQEFLGDYISIVAYNGKAYPVWTQSDQFGRSIITTEIDESVLGVQSNNQLGDFKLHQNFPNPFNPSTIIRYEIPERSMISIKVYDLLGNEIVTLVEEEKQAGVHTVEFDAEDLSGGLYFYQLTAGEFSLTNKMILLK
ncbi:MAG: T9SS type A sorting domain-containing protein [Ignavibacteria bacterium]|jgi:hypothetical protein